MVSKMNYKKLFTPMLFGIVLIVSSCGKKESTEVPVADVKQGVFYLDIHEEGEVKATQFTNISSPDVSWRYGMLKITQIVEDGSEVEAGDTVVVFDPSEVRKAIVESEANMEMQRAEREKLVAEQQSSMEDLKADFEITKISQQISKIRFESADYEADIKRKEIELNLEKANIALLRAEEQIKNKAKIQAEELKQKDLDITQSKARLNEAKETLNKLFVVSPSKGIAVINKNWSSDNKYQTGDQCWRGTPLIELPDLSELKAIVQINEVDIAKITKGLRVEVKPDAFSDSLYEGEVIAVANLAINKERGSKIKVFPVDILINKTSKNLLPGLTVSCRIIIDQIEDVIYIPLEAVHNSIEGDYVYVQNNKGFNKKMVTLGQSNTDFIIVEKGLKAGEKVALINPFADDETEKE